MKNRERFLNTLNFKPVDRLPVIEWANWWNKTIDRWKKEGLPNDLVDSVEIREYFGLDRGRQWWIGTKKPTFPIEKHLYAFYDRPVVPKLKEYGIIPFVDSDGNIEPMVSWFTELGVEGFLPLERRSRIDILRLRRENPGLKMIGGYDKTVMSKGEEEMRAEFERILPVMRQGGTSPRWTIRRLRRYRWKITGPTLGS